MTVLGEDGIYHCVLGYMDRLLVYSIETREWDRLDGPVTLPDPRGITVEDRYPRDRMQQSMHVREGSTESFN